MALRLRFTTPRKSLQVLAYLLLHRAVAVSREYLAFLLYPDDEESSARAKLRATLSELPKILPRPAERYVTIDGDKIAWNPEADIWLDVDAFVEACGDRTRIGEAIDLYRGDLLPEIYDEWLDAVRERHRNAYLRCLAERVSDARRGADFPLAIETARKVLAVDPWREDIVRRIIAMRHESGDRAGALNEYAGFAKRLRAEMGAEPMPETAAAGGAYHARAGAGRRGRAKWNGRRSPALVAILPFVGRHDEMERLLETWNRVIRAHGACVFVGGETGIGKSRLVWSSRTPSKIAADACSSEPPVPPKQFRTKASWTGFAAAFPSSLRCDRVCRWRASRHCFRRSMPASDFRPFRDSTPRASEFASSSRCFAASPISPRSARCCSSSRTSIGRRRHRWTCSSFCSGGSPVQRS